MKIGIGFDTYPEDFTPIAIFTSVKGLEGENRITSNDKEFRINNINNTPLCILTFVNCNLSKPKFLTLLNNAFKDYGNSGYIYVLTDEERIISSHFIYGIKLSNLYYDSNDQLVVQISGWYQAPSSGFYYIIKNRIDNGIQNIGDWKKLKHEHIRAWLTVSFLFAQKTQDRPNRITTITSNEMNHYDHFYIALGEAIHGPGGYFGQCYNSLRDCLGGGFGISKPFTLKWLNHILYKKQFPRIFDDIVESFERSGAKLILQ